MTLGEDIAAALPGFRAAAESRMTATCLITRGGTERVWNASTLSWDEDAPVEVYNGPCRVKQGTTQPRVLDATGQAITEQLLELHLPILTSTGVGKGQTVEIMTASDDPALVGKRYEVTGNFAQSDATSRRLPVEEIS